MTTLNHEGYLASKGGTSVTLFWGDMHILDFRADKVITDKEVLKDQITRFEADKTQFDVVDYNEGAKQIKAVRRYTTAVIKRVDFEQMIFTYQGQEYKLKTRKHSTIMKARKNADEIKEHKLIQTMCLVDDESGEVLGVKEVLGEVDYTFFYTMD